MRLTGWHVEEYGILRDWTVRDLDPGLTVIHGPNEAGKSTLLAFLRGLFFGFPRGSGKSPVHRGGRIFLEDERGGWTLERTAGKSGFSLSRPDGSRGDEADLAALFHHADAVLFRSVFAFDLSDLQDLTSLGNENVKARFFSTGISGAGASATQVLSELDRERDKLFKPRATTLEINRTVKNLQKIEEERKNLAAAAGDYREVRREHDLAVNRVEKLRAERDARILKRERLRLLVDLRDVAERIRANERALADRPLRGDFPPNAITRLEGALERLGEAKRSLAACDLDLRDKRGEIATLAADPALLAAAPGAARLSRELSLWEAKLRELLEEEAELRTLSGRATDALGRLGTHWTEERVRATDTGLGRRSSLRAWAGRLEEAGRAFRAAKEERARLEEEFALVGGGAPEAAPRSPDALREALGRLRDLRQEEATLEARVQAAEEFSRAEDETGARGPVPAIRLVSLGFSALALAGLAAALLAEGWEKVAGGAIFLLGALGAALLFVLPRRRAGTGSEARAAVRSRTEAWREALREIGSRIEREAKSLDIGLPVTAEGIRKAEAEIERAAESARRCEAAATARERLARAAERAEHAGAALVELRTGWEREISPLVAEDSGASAPDPAGALDLLLVIEEAKGLLSLRDSARARFEAKRSDLAAWEADARAFLTSLPGGHDPDRRDLAAVLARAFQVVDEAVAAGNRAAGLAARIEEVERERERSAETLRAAEETLRDLYAHAGVSDEEGFRREAALQEDGARLAEELRRDRVFLASRVGTGPESAALLASLDAGEPAALCAALEIAEHDAARLNGEIEEENRKLGRIAQTRDTLERSTDLLDCEMRAEETRTEGAALVRRWRVLALARALLARTLSDYTAERQPEVLANASALFADCTDRRYLRILQVPGDEEIRIVREDGKEFTVDMLSRGTREDLYVCLRLALADQFGRRSGRLPFVADDVFVNFDPVRARAALAVLSEFARENQVLLFTCHPETVERLREVAPGTSVRELPGPSARDS